MRLRKRLLLALGGALGALTVALPAIAGSETVPTITATNTTYLSETRHYWQPETATVSAGGTIALSNPTETPHGVEWVSGPSTPSCEGVPVGNSFAASGTGWKGTCRFATPGVYRFYCTVHGPEMTGTITVNADGTTTTTMSTGTQPGSPSQGSPGGSGSPSPGAGSGGLGSALAGGAGAVTLAARQHGGSVRGSVQVSPQGAGGRLQVRLLASRGSLAGAAGASRVQVGRLVRFSLPAGTVRYAVPLNARARHALRVHRRLALEVLISLTSPHAPPATITRSVLLVG